MSGAQMNHDKTHTAPSCQGLALASTSLPEAALCGTEKLVDPKAKPWDDDRGVGRRGARTSHILHSFLAVALMTTIAAALVACGKKGDPTLPNGQKDNYPATYPQSSEPQTGVFSG